MNLYNKNFSHNQSLQQICLTVTRIACAKRAPAWRHAAELRRYALIMIAQYMYIIFGLILTLSGIMVIIKPRYYSSKYGIYFDFTGIEWLFGGVQIILGIFFVGSVIRNIKTKYKPLLKCPECGKLFDNSKEKMDTCPNCHVDLEDLKGFFERHPDLKDSKT